MLLTNYESLVLEILLKDNFTNSEIESFKSAHIISYEYTGAGYFVQIENEDLPINRQTYYEPSVYGYGKDYMVGFILYAENKQLTIECHSWGEKNPPITIRDEVINIKYDLD